MIRTGKIIFALCFLITSSAAQADLSRGLEGIVLGPEEEPMAQVDVVIYRLGSGRELRDSTDEQGRFQFLDLRSGVWEMEISEPGFAQLEPYLIRVPVLGMARMVIHLPLEGVDQDGQKLLPLVQLRSSNPANLGLSNELEAELMDRMPMYQGYQEVYQFALARDGLLLSPGQQSRLDGFLASDPVFGTFDGNLPLFALAGVSTRAAGLSPTLAGGSGSVVDFILPTGDDTYRFDLSLSTRPSRLHFQKEEEGIEGGEEEYYQIQLIGSGPIIPGKLWFVAGGRVDQGAIQQASMPNLFLPAEQDTRRHPAYSVWRVSYLGKLTWLLNDEHRLELLVHGVPGWQENMDQRVTVSPDAELRQRDDSHLIGLHWRAQWTEQVVQKTRLSYSWHRRGQFPMNECRSRSDPECRSHLDIYSGSVSNNAWLDREYTSERQQAETILEWQLGEWYGRHTLSAGLHWSRINYGVKESIPGAGIYWDRATRPYRVELFLGPDGEPTGAQKGSLGLSQVALSIQDRWVVAYGLHVLAGLRIGRSQLDDNPLLDADFTWIDPRVMVGWDPWEDGELVFSLGWDRTHNLLAATGLAGLVYPPRPGSETWEYNPGNEEFDIFVRQSPGSSSNSGAVASGSNPDLDTFHAQVDWLFMEGMKLIASGIYRRAELGPKGLNPITLLPNDPAGSDLMIYGGRLAVQRDMADGWQARISYALQKSKLQSAGKTPEPPLETSLPQWMLTQDVSTHTFSAMGSVALPYDLTLAAALSYRKDDGEYPSPQAYWAASDAPLCRDMGFFNRRRGCSQTGGDLTFADVRLTWDMTDWAGHQVELSFDLLTSIGTSDKGTGTDYPEGTLRTAGLSHLESNYWLSLGLRYWY